VLAETIFALAVRLGLEKIIAQMMADQAGAIRVFELLGFQAEATLRNHVKDRYGHRHDLVVMANDLVLTASPDPERMYIRHPR
jgi:RimJ/RimL family protein N-acetyltransferase